MLDSLWILFGGRYSTVESKGLCWCSYGELSICKVSLNLGSSALRRRRNDSLPYSNACIIAAGSMYNPTYPRSH